MTDTPKKRGPGRPKGTTKEAMMKRMKDAVKKTMNKGIHNKSELSEEIRKYAGTDAKKMLEALLQTAETRAEAKLIAKELIPYQHAKLSNVESRQVQDTSIQIKWHVDAEPTMKLANAQEIDKLIELNASEDSQPVNIKELKENFLADIEGGEEDK